MAKSAEAVNRWHVGDLRITRVLELESVFPTEVMLAEATQERLQSIAWLHPHYADAQGMLRYGASPSSADDVDGPQKNVSTVDAEFPAASAGCVERRAEEG